MKIEMRHNSSSITTFVKWAGGKSQLLEQLIECSPKAFNTYYEPFLGGGALFFKLCSLGRIKRAVISDLNQDLINAYVVIRDELEGLMSRLDYYQEHVNEKEFFYGVARPKFNEIQLKSAFARQL